MKGPSNSDSSQGELKQGEHLTYKNAGGSIDRESVRLVFMKFFFANIF